MELKIDEEKDMTYEEYEETRKNIINDITNNTYFTREYFEKMQQRIKREKQWQHKIDELSKEYSEMFFENVPKEEMKDIDFSYYGYYEILKYCIDEIMKNDKNVIGLFGSILGKKCKN